MKIVHYAFVPNTKVQEAAIRVSQAAGEEVPTDFTLTLRLPGITPRLPHISILAVLVSNEAAEDQIRLRFHEAVRTEKLDSHWLNEIAIEMNRARYVEDNGFLQIITEDAHFLRLHQIAVTVAKSVQQEFDGVTIVSQHGSAYRPHLTLSHSADVSGIRRLATMYTEQQPWGDEALRIRSVEVTGYEPHRSPYGTFPGGRAILSNPYP